MPTGYTAYIEDGDITTGKDFLKLCTRAFGVAIDQKDDPLSVPTRREVEAWTPPTPEHDGLKKFALEQIDMCIPSVESINEFTNKSKEPLDLSDEAIAKFIEDNISQYKSSVVYYKKAMNDEYRWAQEKQEWMDKFLESLENMECELNGVV